MSMIDSIKFNCHSLINKISGNNSCKNLDDCIDACVVANEIIKIAEERKKIISTFRLNKLTFLSHGWHYGITGKPLIKNDIEAWSRGPVIPDVDREWKLQGEKVKSQICDLDGNPYTDERLDEEKKELIKKVYDVYSKFTDDEISDITHEEDSAWNMTLENNNHKLYEKIPAEYIKKCYETKIERQSVENR